MTIQELMDQIATKAREALTWCEGELKAYADDDAKDLAEIADLDAKRREAVERMEARRPVREAMAADAEQARQVLAGATRRVQPQPAPVPGPLSDIARQALAATSSTQGLPITQPVTPSQGVPAVRWALPVEGSGGVHCMHCLGELHRVNSTWLHTRTQHEECDQPTGETADAAHSEQDGSADL